MDDDDKLRPLLWRGDAKGAFMAFPSDVQSEMGYALFLGQMGGRHRSMAKTLKGFGGGSTIELRENHDGDTYRAVYTVRYADAVYVLHARSRRNRSRVRRRRNRTSI